MLDLRICRMPVIYKINFVSKLETSQESNKMSGRRTDRASELN
jgi:hypothetical protein